MKNLLSGWKKSLVFAVVFAVVFSLVLFVLSTPADQILKQVALSTLVAVVLVKAMGVFDKSV